MIRGRTASGRPMGPKEFIAGLARKMGRVLEPRPAGRPRKKPTGDDSQAVQTALF